MIYAVFVLQRLTDQLRKTKRESYKSKDTEQRAVECVKAEEAAV